MPLTKNRSSKLAAAVVFASASCSFSCHACAHAAATADDSGSGWANITVYRTTPINYTGLTNMDSGDAHGDVYFGLAQLVLPPLCEADPGFLWCQNRKFLSDGAAHMVYTEFVVEARTAFGDYQPCNPDQKTGVFACDMTSGSPPPPPQCNAGGNQAYMADGLNGTIYRKIRATEGACCSACLKDGVKCHGWTLPDRHGDDCRLLRAPLVQWDDAITSHGCASGSGPGAGGDGGGGYGPRCWYNDPVYNSTAAFVAACNRSSCQCKAVERMSVGREPGAMCHHHHKPPSKFAAAGRSVAPLPNTMRALPARGSARAAALVGAGPQSGKDSQWWTCSGAVYDVCYATLEEQAKGGGAAACEACVQKQASTLGARGCSDKKAALGICRADNVTCAAAVELACPGLLHTGGKNTLACQECARGSAAVGTAGCSSWLVNDECYAGGEESNEWGDYISKLACIMNGTWYSTQSQGQCGPEGKGPHCWWRVAETKRTVNQSCVDNRVVSAVRKAGGDACWQACGTQANNQTSPCWIRCVFETMFGTDDKVDSAMTAEEIAAPFVQAFEANDGCPSVHHTPP